MMLLIGKLQALFILLPTSKGQFSAYSSSEIQDSVSLSNEKYLGDISLRYARSSKLRAQIGESKCTCVCKKCKSRDSNKNKKCCKCTNCDDKRSHDTYEPSTNFNFHADDNMAAGPGESQSLLMVPYPIPYPVPVLFEPVPNGPGPGPGPEAPIESPELITKTTKENQETTKVETTPPPETTPTPVTTPPPVTTPAPKTTAKVANATTATTKKARRLGDIKKNLDIYCNEYGNCFKSFSYRKKSSKGVLDLERRKLEISNNIRPTISVNNIRVPIGKRYGLIELPEEVAENLRPTRKQRK